ncbi:MAG: carbohydrate ABC transporter permease [Spirochaetales bacterium]|nr:carbohydrate ABC transporter permease [Spirochaetales bacterium]
MNTAVIKLQAARVLLYTFIIILALLCFLPFYIMIVNSTRTSQEINTGISLIPGTALIENYYAIQKRAENFDFSRSFLNSAFVAVSAVILSQYISALTAFGFAFYGFPFKKLIFGIVMASMMIPVQLTIFGFYHLVSLLGLLDNLLALILPAVAAPFSVYFLHQYVRSVLPQDIIQAARMDGAHDLLIFHHIALPIMSPGIATIAIFSFVANWNNFLFPLVILSSEENFTLPLIIASLKSSLYRTDSGATYLAVALSIIPIIMVFIFLQRYLITAVSFGSLRE